MEIKRVLYLSFSGFYEHNGISKKKLAQIKGLMECGCSVVNCYYTVNHKNGDRLWMADDKVLANLGSGIWAKIRKRIDYTPIINYIKNQQIELVYMRSEHNASPFLIKFVKQLNSLGVKTVMEIPTYPYDQEYITFKSKCFLFIDRVFRKRMAKELHAIVTFSNQKEIFDQRTIQISNGIDFSSLRLKENHSRKSELHLVGVAEIHYWHGFDRVIAGMANYYKDASCDCKVFFHIVGNFGGERERTEILRPITELHLEKYVILYGPLFGDNLDEVFNRADLGIGSLARHRSNITFIKTLKNREYAARGIPFIYSETDTDFDNMPYILKVPADESPIDVRKIIDFYEHLNMTSESIRDSIKNLSWKNQIEIIMNDMLN